MNYLVAGLGNIGDEYASTRHNIGFMVLDAWAQASNAVFTTQRYGDVTEVSFKGRHFTLLKPSTYMNLSGSAVRYWLQKLHLSPENLIVISDDLNIPFGDIRFRLKGSSGGHNGLENIIALLGTEEFPRIRVGIGNDFAQGGQIRYVLGNLSEEELNTVRTLSGTIIQGVKDFTTIGPEKAMNILNIRQKH